MPLRGRVGRHTKQGRRHCENALDDQAYIIRLLNLVPRFHGGAEGTLDGRISGRMVAGMASDRLYAAIMRFEDKHFPVQQSGYVDPHGKMLKRMEELAHAHTRANPIELPVPDPAPSPPRETALDLLRRHLLSSSGYHRFSPQERNEFEPLDTMALKHVDHLQHELGLDHLPWQVELFGRAWTTKDKMPMIRDGDVVFVSGNGRVIEKLPLPEMRFGQPVEYLHTITTGKLGALLLFNGACCRIPPFSEGIQIGALGSPLMREPTRLYRP